MGLASIIDKVIILIKNAIIGGAGDIDEFLLDTGWTSTDWTGSFAVGWTHTTGNTTILSQSKVAVNATKYQIVYTVTGRTAGTFTIAFGGQSLAGISVTGTFTPTTTSTANLTITPTSTFDGKIVISIKSITAVYTVLKGVYYGDQMAFKEYPVCCVGVPSLLGENFPVIAGQTVRDEKYTVEIIVYVKFADTEANAKEIITTTDAVRTALRADLQLAGYVYLGEIGDTKFSFGSKGDILFRLSITSVSYIKRI